MNIVAFGISYAAVALLGLPAAFHPLIRHHSVIARGGACFLLGAVLLSVEGLVWSLVGIPWTIWTLGVPLGVVSFAAVLLSTRYPSTVEIKAQPEHDRSPVAAGAFVLTLCALGFLAWQLYATRATSPDLLFFWGVKGTRFAAAGGLDAELLGWRFFIHAHVNYPPLLPTVYAWGVLVAGGMPWAWVPITSWIWVAATSAVLGPLLRPHLGPAAAAVVTSVWTVIISASIVASNSGGNAEAPLVAFLTVACAALLASPSDRQPIAWAVVALGFVGAVLTKNEGSVSVLLLTGGALFRAWRNHDRTTRIRIVQAAVTAAGAVGLWLLFLVIHGLPLTDPVRQRAFGITFDHTELILSAMPSSLDAGTATLSWWFLLIALVASPRRIVPFFPAVALCCGLLLFAFVYYLHSHTDPTILIRWTLPRLCQPALSALALWAGLAWFGNNGIRSPSSSIRSSGASASSREILQPHSGMPS